MQNNKLDLGKHGVQRRMISVDNFFVFLRLLFFAICDLVHAVEAMYRLVRRLLLLVPGCTVKSRTFYSMKTHCHIAV